jgi:LacI family transcriptional regulator
MVTAKVQTRVRQPAAAPSLHAIARKAGVSISAVSMALANHPQINPQTRQRIRELSRAMGYRRRPRSGRGRVAQEDGALRLGFALLGGRIEDESHTYMLGGTSAAATELGHRLEVHAIPAHQDLDQESLNEQALQFSRGLDGLILSGLVSPDLMRELETIGMPHVVIGHVLGQDRLEPARLGQIVTCDDQDLGRQAVRILHHRGHQSIGFVCETLPQGLWNDRWRRGYRIALMELGLQFEERWVQVVGQRLAGGGPAAQALAAMPDRPTAYVVPDVRVAASFLSTMQSLGRSLSTRDLVISGAEPLRHAYQMSSCAWLGYDHPRLTAVAVRQLCQLCRQPMPCITEVIVPFDSREAPELDQPRSA